MSTSQVTSAPTANERLDACTGCGAPRAADQRYCLNCGRRHTDSRVPYTEVLKTPPQAAPMPPGPEAPGRSAVVFAGGWSPVAAMVGVGVVALVLGVGVLIGRSVAGSPKKASAPQVITVGGTAAPGQIATQGESAAFNGDWPAGKDGYTVQLQALSKDQTQPAAVAAAKTAATTKGASGVGALDSDSYPSLDGGQYVVYSGVYKSQAEASKALKALKSKFSAKIIHVSKKASGGGGSTGPAKTISRDQLNKLNSTSGSDYFKKSQKLPKKIAVPGPPPAKDKKAPGGGSGGGETIG